MTTNGHDEGEWVIAIDGANYVGKLAPGSRTLRPVYMLHVAAQRTPTGMQTEYQCTPVLMLTSIRSHELGPHVRPIPIEELIEPERDAVAGAIANCERMFSGVHPTRRDSPLAVVGPEALEALKRGRQQ